MPNYLVPQQNVLTLSPVHKIVKEEVWIEPADAHNLGGNKFMPSSPQLQALAVAAAISILSSEKLSSDDTDISTWQARLRMTKPDGQEIEVVTSYTLDMRWPSGTFAEQARGRRWAEAMNVIHGQKNRYGDMPLKDAPQEEWGRWVEEKVLNEFRTVNRFRDQRAETGAILRGIRKLLRMKSTYTREELKEPFVVMRASFDVTKAMAYGGKFADMATTMLIGSMAKSLNIPVESLRQLLPGEDIEKPGDLDILTEKELDELRSDLTERGYSGERQYNEVARSLFSAPLSEIDRRQARILLEVLDINYRKHAKERGLDDGRIGELRDEIIAASAIAYSDGGSVLDFVSNSAREDLGLSEPESEQEPEPEPEPEASDE